MMRERGGVEKRERIGTKIGRGIEEPRVNGGL